MEINGLGIEGLSGKIALDSVKSGSGTDETTRTFAKILKDSIDSTNVDQHQADLAMKDLMAGRTKNIHETMLAIERADASLKLMMQVRNKVLDAYREVMRMQV